MARSTAPLDPDPGMGGLRWPHCPLWAWALLGGAIGLGDFLVLVALDADLRIGETDATALVGLLFFVPYTLLGWAVGTIAHARERADRDRATIARQLRDLERAQRALVQEEKLAGIGRLAAGVAHEVRNPLGVIRASASMARESFDPDTDPHRALGFVCQETDRLDRLIASLLAFAKPQPIEAAPTDVAKVVDRAVELARTEARAASVEIETAIEPGLPTAHVDPDRLAQSLYGLTLNAIQALAHAPSASPRRVRIAAEAEDDLGLCLRVEDTGPGVPPDLRESLFEPFVTTKATGTGLGLPMALRMVEAQHGSLVLEDASEPPFGGAHFAIRLPIEPPNAAAIRA